MQGVRRNLRDFLHRGRHQGRHQPAPLPQVWKWEYEESYNNRQYNEFVMSRNKQSVELKNIIDSLASGQDFTTYEEVLSHLGGECLEYGSISDSPDYKNLKVMVNRLKDKDTIEFKNGKNAEDGFRFKPDCTYYFRKEKEQKNLKNKEGDLKKLFVTAGLQMFMDEETISEPLVDFECINELTNLSLVKTLYRYLGKTVISFKYNKGYKEVVDIIMHPHLLKEYNSRWFLFGFTQKGTEEPKIENFSIDRIITEGKNPIMPRTDITFLKAPDNYYKNYFKDIVGVTKIKEGAVPEVLTIRTTNYKVHQLVKTKPIHESQKEIRSFEEKESEERKGKKEIQEGEFIIRVIPNIELQTRILSYGSGLYVTGRGWLQERLRRHISNMVRNYLQAE